MLLLLQERVFCSVQVRSRRARCQLAEDVAHAFPAEKFLIFRLEGIPKVDMLVEFPCVSIKLSLRMLARPREGLSTLRRLGKAFAQRHRL